VAAGTAAAPAERRQSDTGAAPIAQLAVKKKVKKKRSERERHAGDLTPARSRRLE
jgi:hypothetical protein